QLAGDAGERTRHGLPVPGGAQELAQHDGRSGACGQELQREAEDVVMRRDRAAWGDLAARDRSDPVPQRRSGDVDRRPAAQPRAPAEVEVLPVEEEGLVEAAELVEAAAPHE